MPNLIGTAPNQVPTNGALGNMAFQNKEAVSVDTLVTTALTVTGTITLAGPLAVANGGTGQTSYTDGQLLIGNTTGNTLAKATLTAGTGISVANGAGSITIANTAPMAYPGAGLAVSTGSAWGTSKAAPTGDVVGTTDTQTLTNKRVNPRVSSTASISSPLALNSDNFDQYAATAQAADLTINADSGTPVDGQKLTIRILDNGTPRTITFTGGSSKSFRPVGVTLTASGSNWTYTTTASKTVYFGCVYNSAAARWDIVALSKEA